MKLHSPPFERDLKRAIREAVRSAPELRREYRRTRRFRRSLDLAVLWRLSIPFVLGFCTWFIAGKTGHPATALAAGSIYLLAALCFRVQGLWSRLYFSSDLAALTILPVSTARMFHWQIQKFFRESMYVLIDIAAILGTLACFGHFPLWKWALTLLYLALAWSSFIGMTVFCVLRFPRRPFQLIANFLVPMGVILFFGRKVVGPLALGFVDQHASEILLCLPTAWPMASFAWLARSEDWWALTLCLPVLFIIINLKHWLTGLQATFGYAEYVAQPAADLVPGDSIPKAAPEEAPRALGLSEIEEVVTSGSFLAQPATPLKQFPERVLWAWLTPRQKALAEFVHPSGMAIGAAWKNIYLVLLATCGLAPLAGSFNEWAQWSTLGFGALMIFSMVLVTFVNHGRAFVPMWGGGMTIPMYASFGVGFRELGGFFAKYTLVQLPFLTGVLLITGSLLAWRVHLPVAMGLLIGLKLAGLLLAGRFILAVFAFSSGSNDSSRFRLSAFFLVVFAVVSCVSFLGLGAASLMVPSFWAGVLLWAAALLIAWLFFAGYGWFFRSVRFDQMSQPRQ
jgi:hypothetical protein